MATETETSLPVTEVTTTEVTTLTTLIQMAAEIRERMCAAGWTLATAESCTGGLIGHVVTEISGCSDFFVGAGVVYNYPAKENVLGVKAETLAQVGAVSAEVAAQMAQGARRLYGADLAVSVTGIAGPGGGMPDKPTGTTYVHLSAPQAEWGRHEVWQGDRSQNKLDSARAALELVQAYLQKFGNEDAC